MYWNNVPWRWYFCELYFGLTQFQLIVEISWSDDSFRKPEKQVHVKGWGVPGLTFGNKGPSVRVSLMSDPCYRRWHLQQLECLATDLTAGTWWGEAPAQSYPGLLRDSRVTEHKGGVVGMLLWWGGLCIQIKHCHFLSKCPGTSFGVRLFVISEPLCLREGLFLPLEWHLGRKETL